MAKVRGSTRTFYYTHKSCNYGDSLLYFFLSLFLSLFRYCACLDHAYHAIHYRHEHRNYRYHFVLSQHHFYFYVYVPFKVIIFNLLISDRRRVIVFIISMLLITKLLLFNLFFGIDSFASIFGSIASLSSEVGTVPFSSFTSMDVSFSFSFSFFISLSMLSSLLSSLSLSVFFLPLIHLHSILRYCHIQSSRSTPCMPLE